MVYMIAVKFKATYNAAIDKLNCIMLIVPAFVVACVLHPTLNDEYSGDVKLNALEFVIKGYRFHGDSDFTLKWSLCYLNSICS